MRFSRRRHTWSPDRVESNQTSEFVVLRDYIAPTERIWIVNPEVKDDFSNRGSEH